MPRGGARPGAGRKKNAPNKATKERQAAIAATGVTPLDVMIADMRYHYDRAQEEIEKGTRGRKKTIADELSAARTAAQAAAPYVHPRLAAIEHMGKGGGAMEMTIDARGKLASLVARAVASGEVPEGS
jgi:hypothetical protein